MTADEIDGALLRLWRWGKVQLLIQVHDSILFQYREEDEDWIIPEVLGMMNQPLRLARDREFVVPSDMKIGWNWGEVEYWSKPDAAKGKCKPEDVGGVKDNADGLIKWKGGDSRRRTERPTAARKLSFDHLV